MGAWNDSRSQPGGQLDVERVAENTSGPFEQQAPAPSLPESQASITQSLTQGETFGQVTTIENTQHSDPVQEQGTQVAQQEPQEQ